MDTLLPRHLSALLPECLDASLPYCPFLPPSPLIPPRLHSFLPRQSTFLSSSLPAQLLQSTRNLGHQATLFSPPLQVSSQLSVQVLKEISPQKKAASKLPESPQQKIQIDNNKKKKRNPFSVSSAFKMSSAVENVTDNLASVNINEAPNGTAPQEQQQQQQPTDAAAASADEGRRLYIGNLAYATTEGELKEFFKNYKM